MLCQYTVTNYKCFKKSFTLDMQATNINEHNETLLQSKDGEKFLPLSVLYGPNGAGKSTALEALYSLFCKIMRPICAVSCSTKECLKRDAESVIVPYKFCKKKDPTKYEIFFRTDINEYQYRVSFLEDKIIDETLDKKSLEGKRYVSLFKRSGKEIKLNGSLKNYSCSDISSELTLLSYLAITHKRNAIIRDVIDWIDKKFFYIDYGTPTEEERIPVGKEFRPMVLKMLKAMDVDISDYKMIRKDKSLNVLMTHDVGGEQYDLNLREESSGTIKLFAILHYIVLSLQRGATIMIDELDAKLHPLLLKYVIGLFSDPTINKNKAQLIFTSHDLTTMNSETFRRDEIWFVAKGNEQDSMLYSLVEIKSERSDLNYSKRYLEGKYGADPYLQRIIDWEGI